MIPAGARLPVGCRYCGRVMLPFRPGTDVVACTHCDFVPPLDSPIV